MSPMILNLGCGTKTSDACINVDWSFYLVIKSHPILRRLIVPCLDHERREKLDALSQGIVVHDLRKPLPFGDKTVDAVYHSHVLEHIDRDYVEAFLREIRRVLKAGGIHRICVPDFEKLARGYVADLDRCHREPAAISDHDRFVYALLEQSVRKAAFSSIGKNGLRVWVENTLLGDARKRGETHQWMYDRFNLAHLLASIGFRSIEVRAWNDSAIAGWQYMGLECCDDGREYKPGSLYMECRNPV